MLRPVRLFLLMLPLLLLPALANAANKYALVKAQTSLSLRSQPQTSASRIEALLRFQPVEILERRTTGGRQWARVKTIKADPSKSKTGWVLAEYLSDSAFASVDHDRLNVRRGPGTNYETIMNYGRHFPVQVLDVASNGWVKVQDVDGDRGWVHPDLLKLEPHYVITNGPYEVFNVRDGVGTEANLRFRVPRGYLLQVLGERDGWLNVQDQDGDKGWISAKIVFGWLDPEYPKEKS